MSVHDYPITLMDGSTPSLKEFEGDVLLLVNTATKCGLAGQFKELEALYQTYKNQGFRVIGFPSNQFKNQEPGSNEDVLAECQINFGVTFPLTQKIDVNGPGEDPLFTHLKKEKKGLLGDDIKWNFTKFLVSKKGDVLKRVAPQVSPNSMIKDIEKALEA